MSDQSNDNDKDKEIKVTFMPGCFDSFEGTQEEIDELVAQIRKMAVSGKLAEEAVPIKEEDLELLDEAFKDALIEMKKVKIDMLEGYDRDDAGYAKYPFFNNTRH